MIVFNIVGNPARCRSDRSAVKAIDSLFQDHTPTRFPPTRSSIYGSLWQNSQGRRRKIQPAGKRLGIFSRGDSDARTYGDNRFSKSRLQRCRLLEIRPIRNHSSTFPILEIPFQIQTFVSSIGNNQSDCLAVQFASAYQRRPYVHESATKSRTLVGSQSRNRLS